jgi:hypothetical protein
MSSVHDGRLQTRPLQATLPIDGSSQSASPTVASQIVVDTCVTNHNFEHELCGGEVPEVFRLRYGGAFAVVSCLSPPATHPHFRHYSVWLLGKVSMINY